MAEDTEKNRWRHDLTAAPTERFDNDRVEWPEPAEEPREEPVDRHRMPLDDPDDARFLADDDERRLGARDAFGPFDQDDA